MTNTSQTFSDVRNVILSAHKNTGAQDKVSFYDTWAENYDAAGFPLLAAECVSSFFRGDREKAAVLDVACGTGLVSAHVSIALLAFWWAQENVINLVKQRVIFFFNPICLRKYKAELEQLIRALDEEQKWGCVTVVEVEEWEKAVLELDSG
uniref:Uncharacterized protein n=1 Tax=Cyprinus carpio carpio TaxID=630221 RepID=A0A8C1I125_CYPCA